MFVARMGHARFALGLALTILPASWAAGQPFLSIYEIQSNTIDGDASYYNYATYGQLVDCTGGVVIFKRGGSRPRIMLLDPQYQDGWGGIQVKDYNNIGAFDGVAVGDWVKLTNMEVEEYRGTTFLEWYTTNDPTLTITSSGNPLPPPIMVSVSDIPAPVYDPVDQTWFVENHDAELYESMRLIVRDVTVTDMNLGKAEDNYVLENPQGESCWASDYLNADKPAWEDYHDFVDVGVHFCAFAGLFEQYTKLSEDWDYYQLLSLSGVDLAICGDGDNDGEVTLDDLPRFDECLIGPMCNGIPGGCDPPAWTLPPVELPVQHCLMMDFSYDGDVDLGDFAGLQSLIGVP